jgi:Asp-tRNA(Asn)/Glu-tRNA(Gln) amidotransferase A subunit family amidase
METSINFLSAAELAANIKAGEIISRQAVESFLAQIKKHNPTFNTVATLSETEALAATNQADSIRANGESLGALHGVPITVKEQSYTTVLTTTNSPVVSMPIGLGESGLPVNVQAAGTRYSDRRLLKVVKALSQFAERFSYPLQ